MQILTGEEVQVWVLERGLIFSSLRLGSIALDFSKHVASLSLFNTAAQARFFSSFSFFFLEARPSLSLFNAAAQARFFFSFSFFLSRSTSLAQPL